MAYSSADVPVHHWSYESIDKLAIAGLVSLSGFDARPMTRVQMAYKIKEAIDNIEAGQLPHDLSLDREYIEYLQTFLYKLMNEFRQELILIGVTVAQIENSQEAPSTDRFFNFNATRPIKTEHRYARIKSGNDILLENENGLRLEEGYNLRARVYQWINIFNHFTFSVTPALRATENDTELFFDEADAKFSIRNVEISLAKSAMWWGPGFHGSMLISNNAKPLTLARIRSINNFKLPWVFEKLGSFGVNFFVSKLEKDRAVPEPLFSGLRLEWAPLPYLIVGANRTSIMQGKGRQGFHLNDYWNTFVAKNELSHGQPSDKDTDQLASFDAKFVVPLSPATLIASGIELYGEWAGEDKFAFWENESPGYLLGFFLPNIFRDKGTDLRVEYAKNKSGWYNHGIYNAAGGGTAYTYEGNIIGHHMGGDADDLFLRISKELSFLSTPYFDTVKVGAQFDFERHGLSLGVKEKKTEFAADILWSHANDVWLYFAYELEKYENFQFASGNRSRNHIVLLGADIKF
ncbi:MAG: capsule assembly Wzi family protein [Candidatus Omnitrophica bacterium]|nr:capsule assembly Wzi family protein [Candidatus Omnitrophota bacterium]